MKRIIWVVLAGAGLLAARSAQAQHTLKEVWRTDSVFRFAEGVTPGPGGKFLFVSNTAGNPLAKDGVGSVSTVSFAGRLLQRDWVAGLNAPKDIQLYNKRLYVADLDEVVIIDVDKAQVVQRIAIAGARLLHNIAIDEQGTVYVSDLFEGKIHRIVNGHPTLYLDQVPGAAGMLVRGSDLYVLTAGSLVKIDAAKRRTTLATGMDDKLNGLVQVNSQEFLVSNWGGLLYYVKAGAAPQVLLDTRPQHIPCGIIYYNAKKRLLYMTSDQHNVLYAYQLK